jgi:hypothetical protein
MPCLWRLRFNGAFCKELIMKRISTLRIVIALFAAALAIGCAEIPQKQIEMAQTALDDATKAEANRYAPAEFVMAQDSLRAAMAEIDRSKSQFPLIRSYGEAIQKLQSATLAANHAFGAAKANKEIAHHEAMDFLKQAHAAVDTNKVLWQEAPTGKDGRSALEAIQTDLTAVEAAIAQADSVRRTGDYLTARDQATAALAKANAIGDELKSAIAKMKSMRPARAHHPA